MTDVYELEQKLATKEKVSVGKAACESGIYFCFSARY